MYPFLREMDICLTEETALQNISYGDILAYFSSGDQKIVIHRVVGIDKGKEQFILKGDNEERSLVEKISYREVAGKVVKVLRSQREIDMSGGLSGVRNRILGSLSRYDILPSRVIKKYFIPAAVFFTRTRFWGVIRARQYSSFEILRSRQGGALRLHYLHGGKKSADITLRPVHDSRVIMSSYVRILDRNPVFILKLLEGIARAAETSFNRPVDIEVADPVLIPYLEQINTFLKENVGTRYLSNEKYR